MKKIKRRAMSAAVVALLVIAGLFVYILRYVNDGTDWALSVINRNLYVDGVLNSGTILDRNDRLLASTENGLVYADDSAVRAACLHLVGDFSGNIGSSALNAFADTLTRYNLVNGAYTFRDVEETVTLSVDSALNVTAYNALNGRKGAVVVMNYKTGEVLCMVSSTSYDPMNKPADLSGDYYDGVYLNRAIHVTYPPGSVFKIITLTAALEEIHDISEQTFTCSGSVVVDGSEVVCSGTHGTQDIRTAFANSCNCAFAELSLQLGAETLRDYAETFGITESFDLDGIGTRAGNFDIAADDNALAWSGIGQSTDLVSPISMACVAAAVANEGRLVFPTILLDGDNGSDRLIPRSTANTVAEFMQNNVLTMYGQSRFPGLNLCAKTGTAELNDGAPHSWFVGFLNDEAHPYAFAVIAENSGSGLGTAGVIANTVLQAAVSR